MSPRPAPLVLRKELLAFVLAGLLALAVIALSGWGSDEPERITEAPPAPEVPDRPAGAPSVDP